MSKIAYQEIAPHNCTVHLVLSYIKHAVQQCTTNAHSHSHLVLCRVILYNELPKVLKNEASPNCAYSVCIFLYFVFEVRQFRPRGTVQKNANEL